jgi:hypothetical protein
MKFEAAAAAEDGILGEAINQDPKSRWDGASECQISPARFLVREILQIVIAVARPPEFSDQLHEILIPS